MGYAPSRIGFLRIAAKEKVGCPEGIILHGESLDVFKKRFPKAHFFFSKRWRAFQLGLVRLYGKVVNDVIPPILEE